MSVIRRKVLARPTIRRPQISRASITIFDNLEERKGGIQMKTISRVIAVFFVPVLIAVAQQPQAGMEQSALDHKMASHSGAAPISYVEMKNTVADLERARQATAKYLDVRVAEADGYQPFGDEFPGMGAHFVRTMEVKDFDIEKPPILLYHKDPSAPGGYSLVGVGYLWNAPAGPDGQPLNPPFPKSLARWHRHENICMLPNLANPHELSETQCRERGGQFLAQTHWLVHAWIWKDNPAGVFTPENPDLK
jgi:hypothetical protein